MDYLRSRHDWPVVVDEWDVTTHVQDGELIVRVLAFTEEMPAFEDRAPLREAVRTAVLELLAGEAFWVTTWFAGAPEAETA